MHKIIYFIGILFPALINRVSKHFIQWNTYHCECGGAPSSDACIWRLFHTLCIWICGYQPLRLAVEAVRERKVMKGHDIVYNSF